MLLLLLLLLLLPLLLFLVAVVVVVVAAVVVVVALGSALEFQGTECYVVVVVVGFSTIEETEETSVS